MIRIVVCDDDREFLEKLLLLITKYFTEQTDEFDITIFTGGTDFLADNTHYNAVFLTLICRVSMALKLRSS